MVDPLDLNAAQFRYRLRLAVEQCRICGRTADVDRYIPTADLGEKAKEPQVRCPEHAQTPMPAANPYVGYRIKSP
jgi:hypothetical protein